MRYLCKATCRGTCEKGRFRGLQPAGVRTRFSGLHGYRLGTVGHVTADVPRPRILFENVPDDVYDELAPLAGTAKRIDEDAPIHPSDWDLLVTFHWNAAARDESLHVLSFGAYSLDMVELGGGASTALFRGNKTHARGGGVAESASAELAGLVRRTVIEHISNSDERETWVFSRGMPSSFARETVACGDLDGRCDPLVHIGQERFVYALHRTRTVEGERPARCWALPSETVGHREWLLYVLDELRTYDPGRFPSDPAWQTRATWATPELRDALVQRAQLEDEWTKAQEEFEQRRVASDDDVHAKTAAATSGPWRLLTAQGDDLVAAVAACLTDVGFTVRDMDDHHDETTGAKLEDLRVTDQDAPGWECLAEVKGYTKGAKVNDVPQVTGRPSVAYAAEHGHAPSSVWHVVNTFLATDPSTRPQAIPSDLDLQPLTDAGGALIDTRDLFSALRDVQTGAGRAADVRATLRRASTRWRYEPNP
jgi:hypothetical protein